MRVEGLALGFRASGLEFRLFRLLGLGFKAWGLGFKVWGLGFRGFFDLNLSKMGSRSGGGGWVFGAKGFWV